MHHDKENNIFEIIVDGHISKLEYKLDTAKDIMKINRTFVPDELRGKGLAARLNHIALAYASEKRFSVVPQCSYTRDFLKKNPKYKYLIK